MSTWTNVTDTVLEPGQPIRSVDLIAIKNNILAVPAGAANAPRVQTAAIQDSAVTTSKLASNERMTTANVLARTAGASAGDVGTYAWLRDLSSGNKNEGNTVAGSSLRWATTFDDAARRGGSLPGTWRCMGRTTGNTGTSGSPNAVILWLRIS